MQFSFVTSAATTSFHRSFRVAHSQSPALSPSRPATKPTAPARRQHPTAAAWPVQRFLTNFFFFTPLGKILRGSATNATLSVMHPTILVTGASGGTGRRVVRLLLSSETPKYNVVTLSRSRDRLLEALADQGLDAKAVKKYESEGRLRVVLSDMINMPQDALFGITATISCTGTKAGPVDDNDQRDKYYQGIVLYPTQILESTPENVEYVSVKRIVSLIANEYAATKGTRVASPLFNFDDEAATRKTWGTLDDVVMGGVSESTARADRGALLLSGNVSTQNKGGFVSSRTANFDNPLDLSKFHGIQLRVRGDGQRYKMIIRCDARWDGVSFCYSFDTKDDEWTVVNIPFSECRPTFRGKSVTDGTKIEPGNIVALQLMLSKFEYDGALNPSFKPGNFKLLVAKIQPFQYVRDASEDRGPKYIHLSSAGVTRPQRLKELQGTPAGEIAILKMNEQIGKLLDWKLAGEDCVRSASDMPYTVVRTCALTMEQKTGIAALGFAQGDEMTGRVTRDDMAELLVKLLKCPSAVGKTYEVRTQDLDKSPVGSEDAMIADIESKLQSFAKDVDMPRSFGPFPYVPEKAAVKKS